MGIEFGLSESDIPNPKKVEPERPAEVEGIDLTREFNRFLDDPEFVAELRKSEAAWRIEIRGAESGVDAPEDATLSSAPVDNKNPIVAREELAALSIPETFGGSGQKWTSDTLNRLRGFFGVQAGEPTPPQAPPRDHLAGGDFYLVGTRPANTLPTQEDYTLPLMRPDASEGERQLRRELYFSWERLNRMEEEALEPNLPKILKPHYSKEIPYERQRQRNLTTLVRGLIEEGSKSESLDPV